MARSFDKNDAKRLIDEHEDLLVLLRASLNESLLYKDQVEEAAKKLAGKKTLEQLENIPIDEINRDKRGFRIKALKNFGYETIADIAGASVYNLASIRGISEDAAYSIHVIVQHIVDETGKVTRISLSLDNKTKESTELVSAISKYRKSIPYVKLIKQLLSRNQDMIQEGIVDLRPGTTTFKWIFTSSVKKKNADAAFLMLADLISSSYAVEAEENLDKLNIISRMSDQDAWDDFSSNSISFFNILEDIAPGLLGNDDSIYGLPEDLARDIQDECFFPDGLKCELRKYQEWGVKYILHQERVLLGDEMGLGKTVQAIATMVSLRNTGATHFIVVCPASVISNWCREVVKHSNLRVTKIHGSDRLSALEAWIRTGGAAVTTYETTGYIDLDESFRYSLLVVDEAHYIKNKEAKRTINVKTIGEHADRMLFMTGTALENKVDEMVSLISILQPQVASAVSGMQFLSSAPQFRERVAPVYCRRKRDDVLTELPELTESKEWCKLSSFEERLYEQEVLSRNYSGARRVSWNVPDLKESCKAQRMLEIIDEAKEEGRKIIVFSFFLDTIQKVTQLLEGQCVNPINGSVPPQRRQEIIDAFEQAPAGTVLCAQIQSGGTGLNIQSASVVILCEPQFKPSIENQAISRAYRMGQTRNVLVYRLLCEYTVDEKLMGILEEKQTIFDAFADKSVAAENEKLEIDDKTFGKIIEEEIERINAKNSNQVTAVNENAMFN